MLLWVRGRRMQKPFNLVSQLVNPGKETSLVFSSGSCVESVALRCMVRSKGFSSSFSACISIDRSEAVCSPLVLVWARHRQV